MAKKIKNIFAVIFILFHVASAGADGAVKHKLTSEQARMLIMASLTRHEINLPGLTVSVLDKNIYSPIFIEFMVFWNGTPNQGSVMVGFYAVNPYTGDVFDAVASDCEGYKSKNLQKLQARYRNNILHLTQGEYNKLKTKGPMCDE